MSYDKPVSVEELAEHGASITCDFRAGLTLAVIAERMQCSRSTLNRFIKSRGLKRERGRHGGGQWKWKPEHEAILREMWAEGKSATEVARKVPFTRNAVIGKCHRLRLTYHGPHKTAPKRTKTQTLADNSLKMRALRKEAPQPPVEAEPVLFLDRKMRVECSALLNHGVPVAELTCCGGPIPAGSLFEFCKRHLAVFTLERRR